MTRTTLISRAAQLVLALLAPVAAMADGFDNVQVHGFLSQAATLSKNVNLRGESTDGAYDFSEMGINLSSRITPSLRAAGQLVSVRTAVEGSQEPEIDFLLADWSYFQRDGVTAGVRVGRVRLPNGLHYPARDVAAVRPGIFMPQSVYLDNLGSRAFLYAAQGAQLYADTYGDSAEWQFVANYISEQKINEEAEVAVFRRSLPGSYRYKRGYLAGVRRDSAAGRWVNSLTHGTIRADYQPAATDSIQSSSLGYSETIISTQYIREKWQLTHEASRRWVSILVDSTAGTLSDEYVSLGTYLEARFTPSEYFEWFIRYSELNQQIGDRRGVERSQKTGLPRYYSFSRDSSIGARAEVAKGLTLLAEFHLVDGLETADTAANPEYLTGQLDRYWNYATVMIAYRF